MNVEEYKKLTHKKRPIRHEEDSLQKAFVRWFKMQYPNRELVAIPNAGRRNPVEGKRQKDMGMRRGALDIFIPEPIWVFHGLWLELKVGKNKMSEHQKDFANKMIMRGYRVVECRTFEECVAAVNSYFGMT